MRTPFSINWPLSIVVSLAASIVVLAILNTHVLVPLLALVIVFWLITSRDGAPTLQRPLNDVQEFLRRLTD